MTQIINIYPERKNIYLRGEFPVLYSVELKGSFFLVFKSLEFSGFEQFVYTKTTPKILHELEDSRMSVMNCFLEGDEPIISVLVNNRTGRDDIFEAGAFHEIKHYTKDSVPANLLPPFGYTLKRKDEKDNLLLWMDFETEGLNVNKHRILSFALLLTDSYGNDLKPPFHGFIKHSEFNCDPKAQEIHGLTDEFLQENGVSPKNFLKDLEEFLDYKHTSPYDLSIAGQNVAGFDFKVLKIMCKKYNKAYLLNSVGRRTLELESLSLTFFPNRSVSLSKVANRMGHTQEKPHTALKDIQLTRELWLEYKNFFDMGPLFR